MNLQILLVDESGRDIATDILVPVVLCVLMLLSRRDVLRAVSALAIGGLVLLLIGVAAYDFASGFQYVDFTLLRAYAPGDPRGAVINAAVALGTAGFYLTLVAAILALGHAVLTARWSWFAAVTGLLVLASVIGTLPYASFAEQLGLFNHDLALHILFPIGLPGDADIGRTFYLVMSALTLVTPLGVLLYGLWGGGRPAPALPALVSTGSGDSSVTAR